MADDAALARVQRYCGWHIAPSKSETLTLDGHGGRLLLLPSLYVTDVDTLTLDGADVTEFDWSQAGMITLRSGCFPTRFRSVTVAFTHGYDIMPDDVQEVIDRISQRGADDVGVLQRVGEVTYASTSSGVSIGGSLSDFDKADLASYKLPPRP